MRKTGIQKALLSILSAISDNDSDEDGLNLRRALVSGGKLNNSKVLDNLNSYLVHLSDPQRTDMTRLINSFPRLFSDVPMHTHVLEHDINVGDQFTY